MARNIVLVGMMASGKSTVGQHLATRLGRELVETDDMVETRVGKSIADIFEQDGEATFRRYERDAVREAAAHTGAVISVGGGAVLDDGNVSALKTTGVLVLLDAPAHVLTARAGDTGDRPLLTEDPGGRMEQLLAERAPRYHAVVDHRVDASGDPDAVVDAALDQLRAEDGVLRAHERENLP